MWVSKKKLAQIKAEAVEKEMEKDYMYRFIEDVRKFMNETEYRLDAIENNSPVTPKTFATANRKKQLNG